VISSTERQLGQLLIDRRLMTVDDLERLSVDADRTGLPFTRLLIETGRVLSEDVLRAVATELDMAYCEMDVGFSPSRSAVELLDREAAERLEALPYDRDASGRVLVALADPLNEAKRAELESSVGDAVDVSLAERERLNAAIAVAYGSPTGSTTPSGTPVQADGDSKEGPLHVNDLLVRLVDLGGSDLHVTAGSPPQVRVNGDLQPMEEFGMLRPAPLRAMIYEILTNRQKEELEDNRELDCSHPLTGKGRFRVNVFFQRDSIGAVMRAIPSEIVPLPKLGMPDVLAEFAHLQRGLVLVTGPTGSGKSTTLASLIDLVNTTRAAHIMTIEDPIEFMHRHKRSIVNQRELGADTRSFPTALKHALRQDPDVVLVGEMRDLETIGTAITAAETGHLVFATLHTQDAPKSVERIIDVFPSHQQQQVRVQLAASLQAVVAQQLLPTADGRSRLAAVEVMVATPAIRNLVREGKVHQIASAMQSGGRYGMQTMDQSLARLVKEGAVSYRVALERCQDIDAFNHLVPERYRT
jgi:twitching motility protein PilT